MALAGVVALTACSSNGSTNATGAGAGNSGEASSSKATAQAPAASEQQLLLTNEVPGVTFEEAIDKSIMDAAADPLAKGTKIEPDSCAKLTDASTRINDLAGTFAQFKDQKIVAGVALSKQTDIYGLYENAVAGCSDVKMTIDGTDAVRQITEEQGLPPEAQGILDGMDLTSTYQIHLEKWAPQVTTNPEKVTGEETSGTAKVTGVDAEVSTYRIMGVINKVLIIVTTTPFADLTTTETGAIVGQSNTDITPEAKEAAKQRAIEIFDAQAKKIQAAA